MDKTTLKIIGTCLRREFTAADQLPFPLQQALAKLARRERERSAPATNDDCAPEPESAPQPSSSASRATTGRDGGCRF